MTRGFREAPPRLALVFNVQGGEFVFLVLIALVILGPDKLPDAIRKFGKLYGEMKRMANGFQGELRQALDEPMKELKSTRDLVRDAARFDMNPTDSATTEFIASDAGGNGEVDRPTPPPRADAPSARSSGLNFGNSNARRVERQGQADSAGPSGTDTTAEVAVDSRDDVPAADPGPEDAAE